MQKFHILRIIVMFSDEMQYNMQNPNYVYWMHVLCIECIAPTKLLIFYIYVYNTVKSRTIHQRRNQGIKIKLCSLSLSVYIQQVNGETGNSNSGNQEYILDDDECPLAILMNHPSTRGECLFFFLTLYTLVLLIFLYLLLFDFDLRNYNGWSDVFYFLFFCYIVLWT